MATRRREKMSAVDTAWLRMDRPDNLMVICGVVILADRIRPERLRATLESHFLRYPRFRQRPVDVAGATFWETDAAFDLARQIEVVKLPGKAGKTQLQALVSRLVSEPLDRRRPLWRFHLVDNYLE